jgi:hypothetical protein
LINISINLSLFENYHVDFITLRVPGLPERYGIADKLTYKVVEVEKRLKRKGRGRPSKDAPPPQKELRYKLKLGCSY